MLRGLYNRYILPPLLDGAMQGQALKRQRAKVVPRASGRVLEIGAGGGLNAPYIDTTRVAEWVALEPCDELRTLAQARMRTGVVDVRLVKGVAESLPGSDHSFDSVVLTYTLCSVKDPRKALSEIFRVLRPGGCLFFSEHGLSPDARIGRRQRQFTPLWRGLAGGCHLDRPVEALIAEAGFEIRAQSAYLPGPQWLHYTTWGSAKKPS